MGCINTKTSYGSSPESSAQSHKIDQYLRKERQAFDSEVKLLLLGAGEAGKSTVTKQMKIIHLNGFTEEELIVQKETVHSNTVGSMFSIACAAEQLNLTDKVLPENKATLEEFQSENILRKVLDKQIAQKIENLWKDPGIQETFSRSSEYQLIDSAEYFFQNLDRISSPAYIPTTDDLLRVRVITTGITELAFYQGGVRWRLVDVGGQRSERKKWIHCFQDVTALIFCVALSEYDRKLFEDDLVNRMHESLALFDEICNCQWFYDTSIILFLNKNDLFREKITKVDLNVCFDKYTGGCDYDSALKFIKKQFTSLNPNKQKPIYVHVTCATDTKNMRFVFNAVKDIIVNQSLLL